MDCETVRELAGNYASEELIDSVRERVEQHLSECAACSSFYQGDRELAERLAEASKPAQAGAWFADRLMERLTTDNEAYIRNPSSVDASQLSFKNL